jgi:hypothetical protein
LHQRHILFLIWLCFVLRGVFYCSLLPLWDGFDEWAHFAVIQNVSTSRSLLVDRNGSVSREVDASLALAPLPRGMTWTPPQGIVREQYWQLPAEERSRRERDLALLPSQWAVEYPEGGAGSYESSQAPLYYWLMAVPLTVAQDIQLLDRVWIIRVLTLLLGSLCIPIGFMTARRYFKDDRIAVKATIAVALLPELALTLARVSNESLAVVLYTALLFTVVGWIMKPTASGAIAVGVLLGLVLLTKAYALTAIPALLAVCLLVVSIEWQNRRAIFMQGLLVLGIAVGISGWWYVRSYVQTGTISGLDEAIMLKGTGMLEKLEGVFRVDWWPALKTIILSHVWYGGWNLLGLSRGFNRFWLAVMAVTLYGFLRSGRTLREPQTLVLVSFYLFFWLGQAYQVTELFLSKGSSTAMGGWYLYSVIWAEIILAAVAIRSAFSAKSRPYIYAVLVVAIAITDLHGVHANLIPYYAQLDDSGTLMLSRLLLNQPTMLGANGLGVLWVLYVVSTLTLVGMGWRARGPKLDNASVGGG